MVTHFEFWPTQQHVKKGAGRGKGKFLRRGGTGGGGVGGEGEGKFRGRGKGTMDGLTGRVGGLADMKRLAPPVDEVLPLGPATEPGRPA